MCLMKEVIEFIVKRINEIISHKNTVLNGRNIEKYSFCNILKWVTILISSLQTSLSPSILIDVFKRLNLNTFNYKRYYNIIRNLVVTDASNYVSSRGLLQSSSYNKTRKLSHYEEVVFKASREIFFIPNYITITLDDDLIGSWSKDIQNKLLSQKKQLKKATLQIYYVKISCLLYCTQD